MRILIICVLFFFGCKYNQDNKSSDYFTIDYTYYNGWSSNWSLKIDSIGTIHIKQGNKCYKSNLQEKEKEYLDSILNIALNNITQSKFISDKTDQALSNLIIGKNEVLHSFLVYGDTCPSILTDIFTFLKLQSENKINESSCNVYFKSNEILKNIDTTNSRKFLPPNK